jgi:hypothetical protein
MKKAIIVEYNFMTRIIVDEEQENIKGIVALSKQKIQDKIDNDELGENLGEWYEDLECPYEPPMLSNDEIIEHLYSDFEANKESISYMLLEVLQSENTSKVYWDAYFRGATGQDLERAEKGIIYKG